MVSSSLTVFFIFINLTLAFIKKNIKLLALLMITLMWVLYWGSVENADSKNYLLLYNHVLETGRGFFSSELGFVSLIKLAQYFGLDYNQFLMIVSFSGLLLIYRTTSQFFGTDTYIWTLYFIYPFLFDIVQVRHFLAMSVVIYSMGNLLKGKRLNYVLGILIAFSLQFSSIFFLPFVFVYKMRVRSIWLLSIVIISIGMFFINTSYFQNILGFFININKLTQYFDNRANWGFFVQWIIQLMYLLPIYWIYKKLYKNNIYPVVVEMIYKINIYILMMFPVYMINMTSTRIFRMILILNYIVYAIGFLNLKKNQKYFLFVYILVLTLGMFVYNIVFLSSETVFYPIFHKNLILNSF